MFNWIKNFVYKQKNTRYLKLPNFEQRRKCMLWVEKQREKITFITYLPLHKIPVGTFPVNYQGDLTYIMGIDKMGSYAIDLDPSANEKDPISPLDLFEARSCQGPVYEIWGFELSAVDKIKFGLFIGLIIVLVIVIFLMATQQMGAV